MMEFLKAFARIPLRDLLYFQAWWWVWSIQAAGATHWLAGHR